MIGFVTLALALASTAQDVSVDEDYPGELASDAVTRARPKQLSKWIPRVQKYPRNISAGTQGILTVRLIIDAEGRVDDCIAVRSTGNQGLDKAGCKLFERYGRFEPARDAAGKGVSDSYEMSVMYVRR